MITLVSELFFPQIKTNFKKTVDNCKKIYYNKIA